MTEIIHGLDDITDYSINFTGGKDAFYDVLSEITDKDIITLFKTNDGKECVFSSGFDENREKDFVLFVDDSYMNILKYLYNTWLDFYVKKTIENTDIYNKGLDSITMLSGAIISLSGISINNIVEEIE